MIWWSALKVSCTSACCTRSVRPLPPDTHTGDTEFRELSRHEVALLHVACDPRAPSVPHAAEFDGGLLRLLARKGLIYLDVPINPSDRFSILPLEVSRAVSRPSNWLVLVYTTMSPVHDIHSSITYVAQQVAAACVYHSTYWRRAQPSQPVSKACAGVH